MTLSIDARQLMIESIEAALAQGSLDLSSLLLPLAGALLPLLLRALLGGNNMAAVHLADAVGGSMFLGCRFVGSAISTAHCARPPGLRYCERK